MTRPIRGRNHILNSPSIFDSMRPSDLGLPCKFSTFRRHQREALEWLTTACEQPISAACLPTGSGKTAIAMALAQLTNVKAVYLVATKQLQSQVLKDFASMGMVTSAGAPTTAVPTTAIASADTRKSAVCPTPAGASMPTR